MVIREFTKPPFKFPVEVSYLDNRPWVRQQLWPTMGQDEPFHVGYYIPPPPRARSITSTSTRCRTEKRAMAEFARRADDLLRGGWTETERSKTRRVLVHGGTNAPTKFWAVYRDGATVGLNFGKYTGRASMRARKETPYPSYEAAAAAFDKLLAQKLAAGYVELWPQKGVKRGPTPGTKATAGKRKPAAARRPSKAKR